MVTQPPQVGGEQPHIQPHSLVMPGHDKIAQPDGHQLPYIYRTQKDFMSAATDILAS